LLSQSIPPRTLTRLFILSSFPITLPANSNYNIDITTFFSPLSGPVLFDSGASLWLSGTKAFQGVFQSTIAGSYAPLPTPEANSIPNGTQNTVHTVTNYNASPSTTIYFNKFGQIRSDHNMLAQNISKISGTVKTTEETTLYVYITSNSSTFLPPTASNCFYTATPVNFNIF
jgi:hypothetical protein